MRSVRLFAIVVVLLFSHAALAESAETPSPLAANAALQYWQAFSQLPPQSAENDKIYSELYTISLKDAAVQRLIATSHQSLLYLRRGAALPECDWGLDYNDGIYMLLPGLGKSRDLGRLAALRIRQNSEQGNTAGAKDDAIATMTLARHVGREPIMICLLVRIAVEGLVIDALAPNLPQLKPSYTDWKAAVDSLPKAVTLLETISTEQKFTADWLVHKIIAEEARKPGTWRDIWRGVLSGNDTKLPATVTEVNSAGEVIKMIEDLEPIYGELARFLAMPNDQFDAQYPAFKTKTKAELPLAGVLLPAIDQVRAKMQRGEVRLAMLLAGIAVVEGGPEKLKDLNDPFGTGPFEYHQKANGFELQSQLKFEGQHVTLKFGR
jgi:hypothetical protein